MDNMEAIIWSLICLSPFLIGIVSIPIVILVAVLKTDTDKDVDTTKSFKLSRQKEIK